MTKEIKIAGHYAKTVTAAKTLFIPAVMSVLMATVSGHSVAASLKIGDTAPYFSVKTINGKSVNLSDFTNNKPVYLKFWATWCTYCKVEMPHLQAIYDENGTEIEVLTVNVAMNDSIANIEKFYQKNGFDLPTVFDQGGALTSSYGVVGTPYHVLIDKQGRIAYRTFLATDELDEKIALLSKESNSVTVSNRAAQ
ncbi:MAG: TlpA family protein disulfide reductase [Colwellia sp.]|nr:TlpA family protein disulfide reductase [Colwellia sp.]